MPIPRTVPNCATACSYCRARKVKCDGRDPCSHCINHKKTCLYPPSQRGKGRSSGFLKSTLEARLARVEALIQGSAEEPSQRPHPGINNSNVTENGDGSSPQCDQLQSASLTNPAQPTLPLQKDDDNMSRNTIVPTGAAPMSAASVTSPTSWSMPAAAVPSALSPDSRSGGGIELHVTGRSEGQARHLQTRIWEHHGPGSWCSVCSEPGVNWVTEKTGGKDFSSSAQKLTTAWNRPWRAGALAMRAFNPEPDEETAWRYSQAYFDDCFESAMGVVYRPEFEVRLRAHFCQGGASCTDDVAWYALRNTVYASGCRQLLLKNGAVNYAEAQKKASRLFENALLVHTDLIYGPSGLEAARAIVAMTFYAEAAADQGFEYMISASAVRLVQAKGLHRQPSKTANLSESEIAHRSWLFWAIYCHENQIAFRSGRPSAIDDDGISCEVPVIAPAGSTIDVEFFTHVIKFGRLTSKMAKHLGSPAAFRQGQVELIKAAKDLSVELEAWQCTTKQIQTRLQTRMQIGTSPTGKHLRPTVRPLHLVYLDYAYYSAVQSIHAIFAFPWISAIMGIEKDPSFREEAILKADKVADAARKIILLAKSTELSASLPQWASFYYPISGLINLFVYILNDPSRPSVPADVALLDVAAGHFSHLEFLTSSEPGFPFPREIARLARTTLERANWKSSMNTTLPALEDEAGQDMGRHVFDQPEPFQADQFDMEGWDIYSTELLDGRLPVGDLFSIPMLDHD